MHIRANPLVFLLPALIFAACSDSQTDDPVSAESAAEPESATEAEMPAEPMRKSSAGESDHVDPVAADPGHYTAEFENDAVRILRIQYGAGEESPMHYHPKSVAVFLTDGEGVMTMPDGSEEEFSASAGEVFFNEAGEHHPRNTSDSAWEVIEVELKPRDSSQDESGGTDPTEVDADHYTVELENDAVRVLRINYDPGEESVMHYHPDAVAVFLTDQVADMTMTDGTTEEMTADAGDVMYVPRGQHLPKNTSDSALELVLIELK